MASAKEILEMDIYALLGVESTATAKQIKKAYRQRALSCHPDKNPDNPRAAELFHQLSQALEVLTDAAARAAYDKVRAAKKQAEERNQKLDSKRKKIKLDLEAREKRAETEKAEEVQTSRSLEEEIARLREQGSRELQEQQRLVQEQIQRERHTHTDASSAAPRTDVTPKLKLRWRCSEGDSEYSQQSLLALFQKYGDVMNVLISSKKKGSAVVEFSSARAADLACQNESGLMANPLRVSWLEGRPAVESGSSQSALRSERDYESLVLMQLRRAEERRRLMEEMRREEEEQQHH